MASCQIIETREEVARGKYVRHPGGSDQQVLRMQFTNEPVSMYASI